MDVATARPERAHSYTTPIYESERWEGFTHRAGDIVVCTPPKCGTTWTQMICALLVHQSAALPQPLTRLSRWIERVSQPIEEVEAEMGAQPWRRVVKSHTPLDGLPFFEDTSYVVCGRDPRDALLSGIDHIENTSAETMAGVGRRLGLPEGAGLPFPTEPDALFAVWLTTPDQAWTEDGFPFGSITHFMNTWWAHRRLPNVIFTHYADLTADLDGEMRRLSAFLDIPVNEAVWPRLVQAASFAAMKAQADADAPGAHLGEWASNDAFFRQARMGEWRTALSEESLALYDRLGSQRLAPELKAWLEGGRRATGDPKSL